MMEKIEKPNFVAMVKKQADGEKTGRKSDSSHNSFEAREG